MTQTETRDLSERLDDAIGEALGAPETSDRPWAVEDAGGAEWALRKLRKAETELAGVDELAEKQIAAIEAWRDSEHERLRPELAHWPALLAVYHRDRLKEDPDAKTIRFDAGTLTARKLPDGIVIEDETALLDWALEHEPSRFVRVKESLNKEAVKEAVLKAGEVVPGVTPVEGEVRFAVKVDVPS
jgi:phage host-nuclease inhibitor protein Gam